MSVSFQKLKRVFVFGIILGASCFLFASHTSALIASPVLGTPLATLSPLSTTMATPTPVYCPPDQFTDRCATGLHCVPVGQSVGTLAGSYCCSTDPNVCKGVPTGQHICGDGFCDVLAGENSTNCRIDCPINTSLPRPTISISPSPVLALQPQLDLKVRKAGSGLSYIDGPLTINQNDSVDLNWTSANVTSCTATNGWSGAKPINGSESNTANTNNLQSAKIYTITCSGPSGTVSDFVMVNVNAIITPTPSCTPAECAAPPPFCHYAGSSVCACGFLVCATPTPSGTPIPPPKLDLKVRKAGIDPYTDGPLTILQGDSVDLNWTSANVTSCTADLGWSGGKVVAGTESNISPSGTTTYRLTCSGPGGSVTDFVVVIVNPLNTPTPTPPTLVPSVDIKIRQSGINNSYSDGPITIYQNQAIDLIWNSNNVTSCNAVGDWSGSRNINGSEGPRSLVSNATFVINCSGPNGSASDVVSANVINSAPTPYNTPAPYPQLDLKVRQSGSNNSYSDGPISINQGNSVDLYWTSYNTSYCNVYNGWSGSRQINGTETTSSLQASVTYTMICYGPGGSVTDSVTVLVNSNNVVLYPGIIISKSARNLNNIVDGSIHDDYLTARPGDTLEFIISLRSIGNSIAHGVRVSDVLPSGMIYIPGSTTRDDIQYDDSISFGNMVIGDMNPGQTSVIKFKAKVNDASVFTAGTTTLINSAHGLGDPNLNTTDSVVVAVQKAPIFTDIIKKELVSLQKLGRDITKGDSTDHSILSVNPNDMLEFVLILKAPSPYADVIVRDILPGGISYMYGTTRINGQGALDGLATPTGLSIGSVAANQRVEVRFNAIVNDSLSFPKGKTQVLNLGDAMANSASIVGSIAQLPITINNNSISSNVIAKVVSVPTGMEQGLLGAIFASLIASCSYLVYTRTTLFKKREISSIIKEQRDDNDKFNFK